MWRLNSRPPTGSTSANLASQSSRKLWLISFRLQALYVDRTTVRTRTENELSKSHGHAVFNTLNNDLRQSCTATYLRIHTHTRLAKHTQPHTNIQPHTPHLAQAWEGFDDHMDDGEVEQRNACTFGSIVVPRIRLVLSNRRP
eukprot:m.1498389 g.1498389  ORF g.1498389 m.1498389 type:complete len:142 (-) comp25203_c0_seq3:4070-4495(-)